MLYKNLAMTRSPSIRTLGPAVALLLAWPVAHAQTGPEGFYLGGGIAEVWATDLNQGAINVAVQSQGLGIRTTCADDSTTGWRLFGGYRFNGNFALEAGYSWLGRYDFQGQVIEDPGTVQGTFKARDWSLSLLGIAPVQEGLDLFAKFGVGRWKTSLSASGTFSGRGVQGSDASGTAPIAGLGGQMQINLAWQARAECERFFRVGSASGTGQTALDVCSLNLLYRF